MSIHKAGQAGQSNLRKVETRQASNTAAAKPTKPTPAKGWGSGGQAPVDLTQRGGRDGFSSPGIESLGAAARRLNPDFKK